MKNVLICRTGAFGDVCMAMPVVLAATHHCDVCWLIRRGNAPLLKLFPFLNCRILEVDFLPTGEFLPETRQRIEKERFDALVDFSNWDNVAHLSRTLRSIPVRAVAYDDTRLMLRQRIRDAMPWIRAFNLVVRRQAKLHRAEKWQDLLEVVIGTPLPIDWPLRSLAPGSTPAKVFIQPHASKAAKRWPREHFVTALEQVARQTPIECHVNVGSSSERHAAERLGDELKRRGIRVAYVPFDPTFTALRDALVEMDVALGPDSGTLQLASILGTPTVVVYGPYAPTEVGPRWRSTAVTPPPGSRRTRDVTPDAVATAILSVVSVRLSAP